MFEPAVVASATERFRVLPRTLFKLGGGAAQ
jgi:hypothetical protein